MFTHYYCGTNIDVRQFWGYCRIILPSINNAFVSQVNRVANFSCNINFIGVFITENYNLSGYNRMLYWFTYLQGRNRGITNDNSENQKIKTTFVPPSTNIVDCDFIVMQLKVSIAIYLYPPPPKPCHCPIIFVIGCVTYHNINIVARAEEIRNCYLAINEMQNSCTRNGIHQYDILFFLYIITK